MHDLRVYYQRNISKEEQEALEYLRGYDDIVINKGSAVVVMDREKYVVPLKKDPAADMINKINARINTLHGDGYISDSTLQYLLINSDARAGRFIFSLKYIRRIVQDGLLDLVVIRLPKKYLHLWIIS